MLLHYVISRAMKIWAKCCLMLFCWQLFQLTPASLSGITFQRSIVKRDLIMRNMAPVRIIFLNLYTEDIYFLEVNTKYTKRWKKVYTSLNVYILSSLMAQVWNLARVICSHSTIRYKKIAYWDTQHAAPNVHAGFACFPLSTNLYVRQKSYIHTKK